MKLTKIVYPIKRDDCWIDLPFDICATLQLQVDTTLHVVLAQDSAKDRYGQPTDVQTFLATSMPPRSWSHAFRMGVVLPPGPGSLSRFLEAIENLGISIRQQEVIEGSSERFAELAPNSFAVCTLRHDADERLKRLVVRLINCSDGNAATEIAELVNTDLTRENPATNIKYPVVAWVSPMRTLHAMQTLGETQPTCTLIVGDADAPRPSSKSIAAPGQSSTENALTHFPGIPHTVRTPSRLGMSLASLRHLIDPVSTLPIDASHHLGRGNLAAVLSCDHDERILRIDMVPLQFKALASFQMLFPASDLGNHWMSWICDELRVAGGSVLGCRSSGRQLGRWARAQVTASFSFVEARPSPPPSEAPATGREPLSYANCNQLTPSVEKVARITQCFRALKGIEIHAPTGFRHSPQFASLRRKLAKQQEVRAALRSNRARALYDAGRRQIGEAIRTTADPALAQRLGVALATLNSRDQQSPLIASDFQALLHAMDDARLGADIDSGAHKGEGDSSVGTNVSIENIANTRREIQHALCEPIDEQLGDAESLLHDVRLYYFWPGHPTSDYRAYYAHPVFNFSRPLALAEHGAVFSHEQLAEDSRLRLCLRIHERLMNLHEGSLAIVGAHRCGKTSMLNMLTDITNGRLTARLSASESVFDQTCNSVIAIQINAAVTPPHDLIPEVFRALEVEHKKAVEYAANAWKELDKTLSKAEASCGEQMETVVDVIACKRQIESMFKSVKDRSSTATSPESTWRTPSSLSGNEVYEPLLRCLFLSALKLQAIEHLLGSTERLRQTLLLEGDATAVELLALLSRIRVPLPVGPGTAQQRGPGDPPRAPAATSLVESHRDSALKEAKLRHLETDAVSRARELRNAMRVLQMIATDASDKSADSPALVISVDEIMDSTAWGGEWALPAWRRVVEAPEYRAVRWIFASSHPVGTATNYSPLGNALREYNLGPLSNFEANRLIEHLDSSEAPTAWEYNTDQAPPLRSLRPTITHNARQYILALTGAYPYLLQVTCTHVYEQAVCYHVPVITTRLVRRTLKRRVIPDLLDYFAGQWKQLESESTNLCRELHAVAFALPDLYDSEEAVLNGIAPRLSPQLAKSLERLGLGDRSVQFFCVPLFLIWLQKTSPEIRNSAG